MPGTLAPNFWPVFQWHKSYEPPKWGFSSQEITKVLSNLVVTLEAWLLRQDITIKLEQIRPSFGHLVCQPRESAHTQTLAFICVFTHDPGCGHNVITFCVDKVH